LDSIDSGKYGDAQTFRPITDALRHGHDYYLLSVDFPMYVEAQNRVDAVYSRPEEWLRMSIMSTAGSGKFSSDRTIKQYAETIWNIRVMSPLLQHSNITSANSKTRSSSSLC
jgi:starch phosphorylase